MRTSRLFTVEGIILKRRISGEADRILTVFSKERGKIRLIAKGVRKISSRRAGHTEVFSHVALTVHAGKTLDILSEATHVVHEVFVDTSITKVSYAYYLCELVDQLLPDHQEHVDVFVMLRDALTAVRREANEQRLDVYIREFTHRLLWMLGYLAPSKRLNRENLTPFVESITERSSKTLLLLTKLSAHA